MPRIMLYDTTADGLTITYRVVNPVTLAQVTALTAALAGLPKQYVTAAAIADGMRVEWYEAGVYQASEDVPAVPDNGGITTLLSRIVGTLAVGTHSPQSGDAFAIVKPGGTGDNAAVKAKTDNLPAIPASKEAVDALGTLVSASRGAGAWPWTPTVANGATPIDHAEVVVLRRADNAAIAGPAYTDANGTCLDATGVGAFRLDTGAYRVRIVAPGMNATLTDFSITATGTETKP